MTNWNIFFKKGRLKKGLFGLLLLIVSLNFIAIFHAWKFTHFSKQDTERTRNPEQLSYFQKIKTLVFGINNPKPVNIITPKTPFEKVTIKGNPTLECWYIPCSNKNVCVDRSKTVILFHGYSSCKSKMLDKAQIFDSLGFNTMLVDFMGSGESDGYQTTIGYFESEQVNRAYNFVKKMGAKNIFLFGTSMGAVAIMKAIRDKNIVPSGIILECPFGDMLQTVKARFKNMQVPAFPMAQLLVFWGGTLNGFWAFGHQPTQYAKSINCPTLLLYGLEDKSVSLEETMTIFENLTCNKTLITYPFAGHENYLIRYRQKWITDIQNFTR